MPLLPHNPQSSLRHNLASSSSHTAYLTLPSHFLFHSLLTILYHPPSFLPAFTLLHSSSFLPRPSSPVPVLFPPDNPISLCLTPAASQSLTMSHSCPFPHLIPASLSCLVLSCIKLLPQSCSNYIGTDTDTDIDILYKDRRTHI